MVLSITQFCEAFILAVLLVLLTNPALIHALTQGHLGSTGLF